MNFKDFNLDKKDSIYLAIIAVFTLATILIRMNTYWNGGIQSPDVSIYLLDSLYFANMDYYHVVDTANLYFSPVICMLTALLFKIGINYKLSIFIVTGLFSFVGPFGLYCLLKTKFSKLLSLTGVIIYGSYSIIVVNVTGGYIDVPAVTMSILIILFAIMAINKNPKYFPAVAILFILGFFTRYTVAFTLPVIILYYLVKRNFISFIECLFYDRTAFKDKLISYLHSKEFKYILISIALVGVIFIGFCGLILAYGGTLAFFGQAGGTLNNAGFSPKAANYVHNTIFYIRHFGYVLFNKNRDFCVVLASFTLALFLIGVLLKIVDVYKNLNFIRYLRKNKDSFKSRKFDLLLKVLFVLLAIGFFVGFRLMENHLIANSLLLVMLLILFAFAEKYPVNKDRMALYLLFFSWFAFYFVFITIYPIKVYRYAAPLMPAYTFFVIWGLDYILDVCSNGFDDLDSLKQRFANFEIREYSSKVATYIPIIIMIIMMASTFTHIAVLETESIFNDLNDANDYIIAHDSNYHDTSVIAPYRFSSISKWYLQNNVTTITVDDIKTRNDTYLITDYQVNDTNYRLSQNFGNISLYTHV